MMNHSTTVDVLEEVAIVDILKVIRDHKSETQDVNKYSIL